MNTEKKTGLMGMTDDGREAGVALRGVRAGMELFNNSLRVNLEQHYVNAEKKSIEAVYSFPLPIKATVCGFKVRIGERELTAELLEREAAFEKYDTAIADDLTAYLLDEDTPNHFTVSVGNLAPGEDITVSLSYVQLLDRMDGIFRLSLPTLISLVYTPDAVIRQMDPAALDRLYPPRSSGELPYGLELKARMRLSGGIKAIDCPSHKVKTSWEDDTAEVTFSSGTVALDRDFILNITPKEISPNLAYCCPDKFDAGWIAYIQFMPEVISGKATPKNITFLLDCSGSMEGVNIEQAKSALLLLLASLQEGDHFNLVAYGSNYLFFSPVLLGYTDDNLNRARAWVTERDADMGGTEVLQPLMKVLESGMEYQQSIILLTDGDVGNAEQIVEKVVKADQITRIFTIGLGYGADEELLYRLAAGTGGAVETVHPGESLESVVSRHLGRIKGPQVKSMHLEIGSYEEDIPVWDQHLIPGESKYFIRHLTSKPQGKISLQVILDDGSKQLLQACSLEIAPEEFSALPQIYAKYQLQYAVNKRTGSAQKNSVRKNEAVDLALRYGILSPQTSYVLVDPLSKHESRSGVGLRRVPVGIQPNFLSAMRSNQSVCCSMSKPQYEDSMMSYDISHDVPVSDQIQDILSRAARKSYLRRMIVFTQAASGYWDDFSLLEYYKMTRDEFETLARELDLEYRLGDKEATTLALSLLIWMHLFSLDTEDRKQYMHLIKKAEHWFESLGINYKVLMPRLQELNDIK